MITNKLFTDMKLINNTISIILACIILASCSTTQKITVSGYAGTEIYTPDLTKVGTIDNTGKAQIKLDSDAYYAFLLSKSTGSNELIPFALDYRKSSYTGCKIANFLSFSGASAGLGATVTGLAMIAGGDQDIATPFLAGGLIGFVACGGAYSATSQRMDQIDHAYQFKYLPKQTTNQDITFAKPQIASNESKEESTKRSSSPKGSSSSKRVADKSNKSFKDYGAMVEGIYVGDGQLLLDNEIIEHYSDIELKITRIDKNTVEVVVIEDNGEEFFNASSTYSINKSSNNSYTLTHNDISKATIKIDRNKKAIYLHPRVNIDGDIYTLKITATQN